MVQKSPRKSLAEPSEQGSEWTFFSNYGHAIILLSQTSNLTIREIANKVGVTERAMARIIKNLVSGGYLAVFREGRQNFYKINQKAKFRHPIESNKSIAKVLEIFKT